MNVETEPKRRTWERLAVVLLALVAVGLAGVILFGWFKKFLVFGTFDFAVSKFVDATGISIFLIKGILVVVLIPFFLALQRIGKIPLFKGLGWLPKPLAWAIVICYTSAYFLAMYFATKDNYFHHTGKDLEASKFYAITPEGVRFFDTEGFDPKYGIKLKPVTPQIVANLERLKRGDVAKPLAFKTLAEVTFFDPLTSEPKVWYARSTKGELALFSSSGFDPVSGDALRPVSREVVEEIKGHQAEIEAQRAADEQKAQEAAKSAEVKAETARVATQEESFRERYVNPVSRQEKRKLVALVLSGDSESATALQDILSTSLQQQGTDVTDGLFRPEFQADGSAFRLQAGDWALARKLGLGDHVDAVLFVKVKHVFRQTGELDSSLKTADLSLELKCLDVVKLRSCGAREASAKGAGFSEADALRAGLKNASAEVQKYVKSLTM